MNTFFKSILIVLFFLVSYNTSFSASKKIKYGKYCIYEGEVDKGIMRGEGTMYFYDTDKNKTPLIIIQGIFDNTIVKSGTITLHSSQMIINGNFRIFQKNEKDADQFRIKAASLDTLRNLNSEIFEKLVATNVTDIEMSVDYFYKKKEAKFYFTDFTILAKALEYQTPVSLVLPDGCNTDFDKLFNFKLSICSNKQDFRIENDSFSFGTGNRFSLIGKQISDYHIQEINNANWSFENSVGGKLTLNMGENYNSKKDKGNLYYMK